MSRHAQLAGDVARQQRHLVLDLVDRRQDEGGGFHQ
jgi:hypothetical protein